MTLKQFTVEYGAMAPSLWKQLRAFLYKHQADVFQRDADAITRLAVRGLLSESETHKARRRLTRDIENVALKGRKS